MTAQVLTTESFIILWRHWRILEEIKGYTEVTFSCALIHWYLRELMRNGCWSWKIFIIYWCGFIACAWGTGVRSDLSTLLELGWLVREPMDYPESVCKKGLWMANPCCCFSSWGVGVEEVWYIGKVNIAVGFWARKFCRDSVSRRILCQDTWPWLREIEYRASLDS